MNSLQHKLINQLFNLSFCSIGQALSLKAQNHEISSFVAQASRPYVIAAFPKSGSTFTTNVLRELLGLRQVGLSYSYGTSEQDLYFPFVLNNILAGSRHDTHSGGGHNCSNAF